MEQIKIMVMTYTTKNAVKSLVQNLISSSKSKSTESKIISIDKTCESLVDENITPTIALVVRYLKQDAIKITTRTIYNQREGGNPYREVIDAWIELATFKISKFKARVPKGNEAQSIISEGDLASIEDPVLRYRVSLLFGELKGLRNQLNIARKVNNLPKIWSGDLSSSLWEGDTNLTSKLDNYDILILNDFINGSSNASFDKEGALTARFHIRKSDKISNPGLKEALEKLISKV